MAHPYEHPVEKLLPTLQESARLMWHAYDTCMDRTDRGAEWEKECHACLEQAMAADARIWRIQDQRDSLRRAPGEKAMPKDLLTRIEQVVTTLHGCTCSYDGGFFVDEIVGGRPWKGTVEILTLNLHSQTTQAFAWAWDDRGELRYHVFLRVPPVDSPRDAVQAAVADTPHGGSIPHGLIR